MKLIRLVAEEQKLRGSGRKRRLLLVKKEKEGCWRRYCNAAQFYRIIKALHVIQFYRIQL